MRQLILIFLFLPFFVNAENITYNLLEVNGAKAYFEKSKGQMEKVMYKVDPELKLYEDLVKEWESTYFSWERIRESLAPIYTKRFSEQELQEIIDFYIDGKKETFFTSRAGKKFKSLLPEINQEFTLSGHKHMSKVKPFLYEMIENFNQSKQ